ncbi:hypothetical protein [Streptomyces muensis]|uniref:Uncharacterized protein n=1 Tax=Streptomyces muensis TaxID=1077944 RepID=A0A9X1PW88_STRM4|nr:hypothetical protein [Streptomyces muensis]MCF1592446.1 hypothetical protein [Streptomyces muensis]
MSIDRLLLTTDALEPGMRVVYTDHAGIPLQLTVAEVLLDKDVFTTRATRSVPALEIPLDDVRAGRLTRRPTRTHTPRIASADPDDPAQPGTWFVAWCAKCGWQTVALAVEAAARYQFRRFHPPHVRKAPPMPLPTAATLLTGLAANALLEFEAEVDPATLEAVTTHEGARITFASSGDPATDRGLVEQINGELCLSRDPRLDNLAVVVRPSDDDATLAAAANSLRHLATLLDRAAAPTDQDPPAQMDRATALRFAENVLSSVG